jgi:hypothetical protein
MSIRKNTIINLTGAVIPILVMLVTVPLYLKILGDIRYGVLALVWLLLGYFSFLEMGLGETTWCFAQRTRNDLLDCDNSQCSFWNCCCVDSLGHRIICAVECLENSS